MNGYDDEQQPPQQPQPPLGGQPNMMEKYGPLIGSALLGYLNMISSPKLGGWNNALRQGAYGGLQGYQSLEAMAQQSQAQRQRSAAMAQLTPDEQKWATLQVPAEKLYERSGAQATNHQIVETLHQWMQDPSLTPQQRASGEAWSAFLATSQQPHKFEDVAKAVKMGEVPRTPPLTLEQRKELAQYESTLPARVAPGGTKQMTAAQIRAAAAAHPDDPELQAMVQRLNEQDANKLTSSTRTMMEAAPKVLSIADRVDKLIDENVQQLGPAKGRWAEFMAGTVGANNPSFTRLRTDIGLLTTLLMRMHTGARGGEYIMQHFQELINSGKQSPENMKAALQEVRAYAEDVKATGKAHDGGAPEKVAAPPPTSVADSVDLGDGFVLHPVQ